VAAVRSALQGEDASHTESTVQELQESIQKVGELVYSQANAPAAEDGQAAPPSEDSGAEEPPEDAVEGEFREV